MVHNDVTHTHTQFPDFNVVSDACTPLYIITHVAALLQLGVELKKIKHKNKKKSWSADYQKDSESIQHTDNAADIRFEFLELHVDMSNVLFGGQNSTYCMAIPNTYSVINISNLVQIVAC